MRNVHDVATYSVLGIVFLLAFRFSSEDRQGVHIVEKTGHASVADPSVVTVTGTADMLIPPDEISVNISYREYWGSSSAKKKIKIDTIEKKIVKAAKKAGLPATSISIDSYNGWKHNWNYWHYWYGTNNMLVQRNLTIQLNTTSQLKEIVANLKAESIRKEGIVGITLSGSSHSKIQVHRKEVKKRALQAAKEKASYLLGSVGETRGRLVGVTELKDPQTSTTNHGYGYPYWGWGGWGYSQTQTNLGISNASVAVPYNPGAPAGSESGDLSMKAIRLQYAIEARFEIGRS
jgi:uncharacterized protein YggE